MILVTSDFKESDKIMDKRFGRCAYFQLFNDSGEFIKAIDNPGGSSGSGAGIQASQAAVDEGATVVITGSIGPNAYKILNGSNVQMYKGTGKSCKEEIIDYLDGKLDKKLEFGPAHHGLK